MHRWRLKSIVVLGLAALSLWPAAVNAQGPTPSERAAYDARGADLNRLYGNAWTRLSTAEYRRLVSAFGIDATDHSTPQELAATLARGEGMNRLYRASTATTVPTSSGTFQWADAGIGFAAAWGTALLAVGLVFAARRRGSPSRPSF
jgi:hypothetical protein